MGNERRTHTQEGEDRHHKTERWTARLRRINKAGRRNTSKQRDQRQGDRDRGTHMKGRKDTSRQTDGRTYLDTQEGQDRQQQTVRQNGQRETDTHVGEDRHRQWT